MVYYYRNSDVIEPCNLDSSNMLVYPDTNDLRNFAFLYIYSNNEMEAVIRTANLSEHYYALMPLIKISKHLKEFGDFLIGDDIHCEFDEEVTKAGTLQIYYSTTNLQDKDAFGYINAPATLTDYQKQFIRDHLAYFKIYQEILINQYDESQGTLKELNFFGDGTFLQILNELSENPEVTHNKGR